MSVFVKGMKMPRSCWECDLHCFRDKEEIQWGPITIIPEDFRCGGNNEWHETNEFDFLNERHPDCPIVDIPTPHGRLIDAEKAAHSILMMGSHPCGCSIENVKDVVEWLRFVNGDGNNFAFPTIIEAEVSE